MIKKFFSTFKNKLPNLFMYTRLYKLKVFQQVLIIIGIMLLFIGVQGIISIKINNTMRLANQRLFQTSVNQLTNIGIVKAYLEQIKSTYLDALSGNSTIDLSNEAGVSGLLNISGELEPSVRALRGVDPERAGTLLKYVDSIKQIFALPVNADNYKKLLNQLSPCYVIVDNLNNEILISSSDAAMSTASFATTSQVVTMIILLLSAIISIFLGLGVASSVSRPLKSIAQAANQLATGDLSIEVKAAGSREVVEVVQGLNHAIAGLRDLIAGVNHHSETLLTASTELKDASTETGRSANQVSQAMEELAKAATEESDRITKTVEEVNMLSELVKKTSDKMELLATSSNSTADSARLGQTVTRDIATEINEIYDISQEVSAVIEGLNSTSDEITQITTMITGIAEQTSLLALNASIEAARAGEYGKGFSVVARETGKLADQSKEAANLITNLVNQMVSRNLHAVDVIQKELERVVHGKDLATSATGTFNQIFNVLQSNLEQIAAVAESARQMMDGNEKVIDAISSIATFSEESLASTEEVSATAQEQSASVEQSAGLAENLAQVANSLKQAVSLFRIE